MIDSYIKTLDLQYIKITLIIKGTLLQNLDKSNMH